MHALFPKKRGVALHRYFLFFPPPSYITPKLKSSFFIYVFVEQFTYTLCQRSKHSRCIDSRQLMCQHQLLPYKNDSLKTEGRFCFISMFMMVMKHFCGGVYRLIIKRKSQMQIQMQDAKRNKRIYKYTVHRPSSIVHRPSSTVRTREAQPRNRPANLIKRGRNPASARAPRPASPSDVPC